jgi:hypothetical protein
LAGQNANSIHRHRYTRPGAERPGDERNGNGELECAGKKNTCGAKGTQEAVMDNTVSGTAKCATPAVT